jgi:hypothetical protein
MMLIMRGRSERSTWGERGVDGVAKIKEAGLSNIEVVGIDDVGGQFAGRGSDGGVEGGELGEDGGFDGGEIGVQAAGHGEEIVGGVDELIDGLVDEGKLDVEGFDVGILEEEDDFLHGIPDREVGEIGEAVDQGVELGVGGDGEGGDIVGGAEGERESGAGGAAGGVDAQQRVHGGGAAIERQLAADGDGRRGDIDDVADGVVDDLAQIDARIGVIGAGIDHADAGAEGEVEMPIGDADADRANRDAHIEIGDVDLAGDGDAAAFGDKKAVGKGFAAAQRIEIEANRRVDRDIRRKIGLHAGVDRERAGILTHVEQDLFGEGFVDADVEENGVADGIAAQIEIDFGNADVACQARDQFLEAVEGVAGKILKLRGVLRERIAKIDDVGDGIVDPGDVVEVERAGERVETGGELIEKPLHVGHGHVLENRDRGEIGIEHPGQG